MHSYSPKLLKMLGGEIDMALKRRAISVIEEIDLQDELKVLDLGCGPGYYFDLIFKLNPRVKLTGLDMDKEALEIAKNKVPRDKVKILYGSIYELPFKDNEFDRIILSEVLEHLPDDVKGLKEVYRVLKPGGILCITVPNANYPFLWDPINWLLERTTGKHIDSGIWTNHLRLYLPDKLMNIVKNSKFKIIKTESLTWWCIPFNHQLLYSGRIPELITSRVVSNKGTDSVFKDLLLKSINFFDKINQLIKLKDIGVGILLVAKK